MSGPKGASYDVVSAEELRRRTIAAARARVTAMEHTIAALEETAGVEAAHAGGRPTFHRASDDVADLERQEATGQQYAAELRRIIARRQVQEAHTALVHSLADIGLSLAPTHTAETEPMTTSANADESLRQRLTAVAERLAETSDADRVHLTGVVTALAERLDTMNPAQAAQAIDALRGTVAQAIRAQRSQLAFAEARYALAQEYADVDATSDAWRYFAHAVDGTSLAVARTQLRQAREEAKKAADQDFTVRQAAAALEALGYRVEASVNNGYDTLTARKASWPNHGLRLHFPEAEALFVSTPVAFGHTDARDDVAFERSSCADVADMWQQLRDVGIDIDNRFQHQPGAIPLAHEGVVEETRIVVTEKERTL